MWKSKESREKGKTISVEEEAKKFLRAKENDREETAAHIARLRALRLTKEAADEKEAEVAADENAAANKNKLWRSPHGH